MKKWILTILILLTGSPYAWQFRIAEKYDNFFNDAEVKVVEEMPKWCSGLIGCRIIFTDRMEIYIQKDAKNFEDVLVHELWHYQFPILTEWQVKDLTKKTIKYIN